MDTAGITLEAYKRQSTLGAGLGVKRVTRAAAQVPQWLMLAGNESLLLNSLLNNVLSVSFMGKLHRRLIFGCVWADIIGQVLASLGQLKTITTQQ